MKKVLLFTAFVATVWAANALTERYGFVPVGLGLAATAGTYAAGFAFGLRDALHEVAGRWVVLAAIAVGAVLSVAVSPSLAVASGTAFLVSEVADLAVYEPLRRRRWVLAVIASNLVGAFVDTVVFLHLAGFPIRPAIARSDGAMTTKLHGLRMLNPDIFTKIPLSSADSTNIARNTSLDSRWRGSYQPKTQAARGLVLADRIEYHQSPDRVVPPVDLGIHPLFDIGESS